MRNMKPLTPILGKRQTMISSLPPLRKNIFISTEMTRPGHHDNLRISDAGLFIVYSLKACPTIFSLDPFYKISDTSNNIG